MNADDLTDEQYGRYLALRDIRPGAVKAMSDVMGFDVDALDVFYQNVSAGTVSSYAVRAWPPDPRRIDEVLWTASWSELEAWGALGIMHAGISILSRRYEMLTGVDVSEGARELTTFVTASLTMPAVVSAGLSPVLFLTPAQQLALWLSDPPETDSSPPAFVGGVMVLFAEPIPMIVKDSTVAPESSELTDMPDGAVISEILGAGFWRPDGDEVTLLLRSGINSRIMTHSGISLNTLEDEVNQPIEGEAPASIRYKNLAKMLRCVKAAAYDFGMQDHPPAVLRPDRAESRRRDRALAKRKAPPTMAVIRYLRDSGAISVKEHRETGRHVRPHLRRGHFRNMRTGAMSLPREDRPTVRRYVAPVIVNGHLGMPHEVIAYRDVRKSSFSAPVSQASSNASA